MCSVCRTVAECCFTLLRAFDELERTSDPFPYARLAKAAGVSRRSVHLRVERALASRRAASQTAGDRYDLLAEVDASAGGAR